MTEKLTASQIIEAQRNFLTKGGIVYDPEFVVLELKDRRRKAVFDLHGTLVSDDGEHIRPGAIELLKLLKNTGVKIILWSSGGREFVENNLLKHDLKSFFDITITRENYFLGYDHSIQFPELLSYQEKKFVVPPKRIHLVSYFLLIDNVREDEIQRTTIFKTLWVPDFYDRNMEPLPDDLGGQIFSALSL